MQNVFVFELKLRPQNRIFTILGRLGTFTDKDIQSTGVTCSGCTAIDSRLSRQWRICVFICIYIIYVFIECSIAVYL